MKTLVIACLVAIAGAAHAQPHKCTMPSGKVEYTDAACPSEAATTSVRTNQNSLPGPAPVKNCKPDPAPVDENAAQCRFQYFAAGDDTGKALAADAKRECLANLSAKRACAATSASSEAYQRWKDHHDQTIARRGKHRSLNCVPSGYGMSCS